MGRDDGYANRRKPVGTVGAKGRMLWTQKGLLHQALDSAHTAGCGGLCLKSAIRPVSQEAAFGVLGTFPPKESSPDKIKAAPGHESDGTNGP